MKKSHWLARILAKGTLGAGKVSRLRGSTADRRRWLARHAVETATVITEDKTRLAVIYARSKCPDPQKLPVLITHGLGETKELHLHRASLLMRRGHNVILFDLRAHGQSSGRYNSFGVRERHDAVAVVDHAQQQGWVDDRLITVGYSLGAGTMLQHASIDPRVAAVVAVAPFADLNTAVRSYRRIYAPWMGEKWLLRGFEQVSRRQGFEMAEASTIDAITNLDVPVLLVAGERDVHLSEQHHTSLLAAAKKSGTCQLLRLAAADHITLRTRRWQQLNHAIVQFCQAVKTELSPQINICDLPGLRGA